MLVLIFALCVGIGAVTSFAFLAAARALAAATCFGETVFSLLALFPQPLAQYLQHGRASHTVLLGACS
eukprot:6203245-Pleurochrysis_carterae.AAC.5